MSEYSHHHPEYDDRKDDWKLCEDARAGESTVKMRKTRYLPSTSGQRALGMGLNNGTPKAGQALYDAYLARAVFPDILRATSQALVGLAQREPWDISVPDAMLPILEAATERGEPIETLIDRMLTQVLDCGRIGLLVDINPTTNLPYFADYTALRIINWDDNPVGGSTLRDLSMVVLDEERYERDPNSMQWSSIERYRILDTEAGAYRVRVEREGIVEEMDVNLRGESLDFVPFTFVNATDLLPTPGDVPLLGLARMAMTIYRGEADYRLSLFMQGQDTLVLQGVANPALNDISHTRDDGTQTGSQVIVGAGTIIYLPNSDQDAKFIGVDSNGLPEQRNALENDYRRAEQFGVALLTSGNAAESASTLLTRAAGRTASMATIIKAVAGGLQQGLRHMATWMRLDPNEVKVAPNMDLIQQSLTPTEFLRLVEAKRQGGPLSWKSVHEVARRGGLTEMEFDAEAELLEEDAATDDALGRAVGEPDADADVE